MSLGAYGDVIMRKQQNWCIRIGDNFMRADVGRRVGGDSTRPKPIAIRYCTKTAKYYHEEGTQ